MPDSYTGEPMFHGEDPGTDWMYIKDLLVALMGGTEEAGAGPSTGRYNGGLLANRSNPLGASDQTREVADALELAQSRGVKPPLPRDMQAAEGYGDRGGLRPQSPAEALMILMQILSEPGGWNDRYLRERGRDFGPAARSASKSISQDKDWLLSRK